MAAPDGDAAFQGPESRPAEIAEEHEEEHQNGELVDMLDYVLQIAPRTGQEEPRHQAGPAELRPGVLALVLEALAIAAVVHWQARLMGESRLPSARSDCAVVEVFVEEEILVDYADTETLPSVPGPKGEKVHRQVAAQGLEILSETSQEPVAGGDPAHLVVEPRE